MNEIESNRNLGCAVVSAGEKKVMWRTRGGIARADSVAVLRHFFVSFLFLRYCGGETDKRKENKRKDLFRLTFRVERSELFCFVS